jgi:D-inositol-3-phosphate glycosyltransferase
MLELEYHVQFVGAKSQDWLPDYYRAAEALVMPSDYESFGMVALEAMACGTPVIASEVGGLAFLIQDGVTGYHIPVREPNALADRIIDLLDSPDERDRIGWAAYETAKHYSWSHVADQLLEVFAMLGMRPRIYPFNP